MVQRCLYSYRQRYSSSQWWLPTRRSREALCRQQLISQSDCQITSNCGKIRLGDFGLLGVFSRTTIGRPYHCWFFNLSDVLKPNVAFAELFSLHGTYLIICFNISIRLQSFGPGVVFKSVWPLHAIIVFLWQLRVTIGGSTAKITRRKCHCYNSMSLS